MGRTEVYLALGDVDGVEQESAGLLHLLDAGGGLLGDADEPLLHLAVLVRTMASMTGLSVDSGSATLLDSSSALTPWWMSNGASSRMRSGPPLMPLLRQRLVHHQHSSSAVARVPGARKEGEKVGGRSGGGRRRPLLLCRWTWKTRPA